MAQIVVMPKEGITVESCLISNWRKNIGDPVAVNEVLFEYETDKAVFECLSTAEGALLHRYFEQGDEAPVLRPVAIIGAPDEDIAGMLVPGEPSAGDSYVGDPSMEQGEAPAGDPSVVQMNASPAGNASVESMNASPRARILAEDLGVDLAKAEATGPGGRIVEADVIMAANASYSKEQGDMAPEEARWGMPGDDNAPKPADKQPDAQSVDQPDALKDMWKDIQKPGQDVFVDEQFSNIRIVIAKTMMASLQRSAQVTHHHSFDASSILAMREEFKALDEAHGYKGVSIGDIILYVTSRILFAHPEINALVDDGGIRKYFTVNLGVAVDTPRGLMVPTVFGAEKKSLRELSGEVKALAASAKEGRISPDALSGGTFTVSNLGATGVESFTPIINPPQAAILGVCGIVDRVYKRKDGRAGVYPSIGLSLSYDHRAVDGAPASRFAAELCDALADFSWKTLALEK